MEAVGSRLTICLLQLKLANNNLSVNMREMKTKSLLICSPAILVAWLCLPALDIINTPPVNTCNIALAGNK